MKLKYYIFIFFLLILPSKAEIFQFPTIKILKQIPKNSSRRLSSKPYISGDTFRALGDFIIDKTNTKIDTEKIKAGDIIFIKNHTVFLDFFFKNVHPTISCKYILITHNEDKSNFDSYLPYLDDDNIIAWFGVNLTLNHKKAFAIPIGLANRYWKHGNIEIIDKISKINPEKKFLLYMNFTVNTNSKKRKKVAEYFNQKNFCHKIEFGDFQNYIIDLKKSKFVLSPEGNGIDCHRTWEALYMGAIPIVSRSGICSLFTDLPVIIIDNWETITPDFLNAKYKEISFKKQNKKYNLDKLFTDYWHNKILEYKIAAKKQINFYDHIFVSFDESMKRYMGYDRIKNNIKWKKIKYIFDKNIILTPKYQDNPIIPKIIHQVWLGNNGKLPDKYKHFQKTWLDNHPDWEYKLWTEKEIDEFGLKNRKQYDGTNNYGIKSDIARYEILYRFGGLYVDTDFECLRPFDILHHMCDFYAGIAYAQKVEIYNGLIGASAQHPILLECINNISDRKQTGKEHYNEITNRTGPLYLTRCFFNGISTYSGPSVIFPVTYFYAWPNYYKKFNSPDQIKSWINSESFGLHHWFSAWAQKK